MDGIVRANRSSTLVLCIFVGLLILATSGCMGLMTQMMWVIRGHDVAPAFDGLKKKQVAIVCLSDSSNFGPDAVATGLTSKLTADMTKNMGKGFSIIPQVRIDSWMDTHGWENVDPGELGKELGADAVVVVEVDSFTIHEGTTMLKGRCNVSATVHDIAETGGTVYSMGPERFVWPGSGVASLQVGEHEFHSLYLTRLATFIGQNFYKHDGTMAVRSDSNF